MSSTSSADTSTLMGPAAVSPIAPIVYVVDNDSAVLEALCLLLRSNGLQAVACASAQQFLACYTPEQIGCLVLDIRMPEMSGPELQAKLKEEHCPLPIIFITGHGDVDSCRHAFLHGAVNFLTKPVDEMALLSSIRGAIQASILQHSVQARTDEAERRLAPLSPRELQVLEYIVQGLSSRQIAGLLKLSTRTVESHRGSIFDKLQVNSLAELIRLYLMTLKERAYLLP